MPEDLVYFKLRGAISVPTFRDALEQFYELAAAIAEEVAPGQRVEWEIRELEGGSAGGRFAILTDRPEYSAEIRHGMTTCIDAVRQGHVVPFNARAGRAARVFTSLVGTKAEGLEFDADYGFIDVPAPVLFEARRRKPTVTAFGMVKGEVDQLIRSKSRFVVFAEPDRRAVSCWIVGDSATDEFMSGLYGKRVRALGDVERDRASGRLVRVANIETKNIEVIGSRTPDFERALGVIATPPDYPPPEERRAAWED